MLTVGKHHLRAMEPADAEAMHRWENQPAEWWVGATMGPWSLAAMEALARGEQEVWATGQTRLILTHATLPVGAFDLFDINPRNGTAGVGVLIDAAHRDQGHAAAGLQLLHNYAFDHLGLAILRADVPTANPGSTRLFEQAGYTNRGTLPGWVRRGAEREDISIFTLNNPAL